MNQPIVGLDPSTLANGIDPASTASSGTSTFTCEHPAFTVNTTPVPGLPNQTISYQYPEAPTQQANPENRYTEAEISKIRAEDTSYFVNDITVPSLRMLLTQVLTTIDVAIPNKDQNRAVKRTVREDFDTAYLGILGRAYPGCNYASSEGRFALDPAPAKEGNSSLG